MQLIYQKRENIQKNKKGKKKKKKKKKKKAVTRTNLQGV
jgi:hypothetical protein